jgi:hypothetical protein
MKFDIRLFLITVLMFLAIGPLPLEAQGHASTAAQVVPVILDQFPTAETHHMMKVAIETSDCLGKWAHLRALTPIDKQTVVRMNRDTLYSSVVLDLAEPTILVKPDTRGRYQSLLVINEAHFAKLIVYDPGEYKLTKEKMGSRYVFVIARTLVDEENPNDVAEAHMAQDGLQVKQTTSGLLEVPNWDPVALGEMREALKMLGKYLPNRDKAYGAGIEEVDPIAHLISSADAWGGWQPEHAVYQSYVPRENNGNTTYTLTLKNVPAAENAFWSISVYNKGGYFQKNEHNKYVINSLKAKPDDDGGVTIHFGGDPSLPNFLPIMPGWNYLLRIYLPQETYFNGTWRAPEAQTAK